MITGMVSFKSSPEIAPKEENERLSMAIGFHDNCYHFDNVRADRLWSPCPGHDRLLFSSPCNHSQSVSIDMILINFNVHQFYSLLDVTVSFVPLRRPCRLSISPVVLLEGLFCCLSSFWPHVAKALTILSFGEFILHSLDRRMDGGPAQERP